MSLLGDSCNDKEAQLEQAKNGILVLTEIFVCVCRFITEPTPTYVR